MTPKLKLELFVRPSLIQVTNQKFQVDVYFDEELAFTLDECYNDVEDAKEALKNYLMERS